jgi:hypothetical protein
MINTLSPPLVVTNTNGRIIRMRSPAETKLQITKRLTSCDDHTFDLMTNWEKVLSGPVFHIRDLQRNQWENMECPLFPELSAFRARLATLRPCLTCPQLACKLAVMGLHRSATSNFRTELKCFW